MARNSKSRLNKLLEFIGLVDDEPDNDFDEEEMRSGRTYYPPSRKSAPEARPVRSAQPSYDARNPDRYTPTGRADANQRTVRDYERSESSRQDRANDRSTHAARSADLSSSFNRTPREYERVPSRPDSQRLSSRTDYDRYSSTTRATDYDRPSPSRESARDSREERTPSKPSRTPDRARGNVVNLRQDPRPQTVIYYLRSLEECRDVINDLLDSKSVLLNLEEMNELLIQRAIDTLSGAAFALNATLRKASDKTYLIAPTNVDVAFTNDMERRY